jgi:subtilase family serine protease
MSRIGVRKKPLAGAAIIALLAAMATAAASPATAASPAGTPAASPAGTPAPDTPEKVPMGVSAAQLPGAAAFGSTPASTPETVSFILRERHAGLLQAQATTGFSRYLTVRQFAAAYGQTPASISALTGYLARYGITATVYPDDLDVVADGTAGEFDRALSVTQHQYHVPAQPAPAALNGARVRAQDVHGTAQSPLLPYRLASLVTAVFGLTNYAPYASDTAHVNARYLEPQQGSSSYCVTLTGLDGACRLPSDFAATYGLGNLYEHQADGEGQTLAIVTLAAVDPGAPQYFWDHIAHVPHTSRTFTVQDIDGGPGEPSALAGSSETDLDIEQAGAVAPGADVIDYQAPNDDTGFADAFFTVASQDAASTVSASWGESETALAASIAQGQEAKTYLDAFGEAFLEMAAQGQSGFLAAGDSGAYEAFADLHTTNLSVNTAADSPYITAAGGTTLPWTGTIAGPDGSSTVTVPAQRAWGWDYLWPAIATATGVSEADAAQANIGGTGGGFSAVEGAPAYQLFLPAAHDFSAVPYLVPSGEHGATEPDSWTFTPTPSVTSGQGGGRAVPDLSADADPYSGYLLYAPSFTQAGLPAIQGGWGGTSFVAPQLNGAAAVIDAALGHRTGFWNPRLYAVAQRPGSPFTELDQAGPGNDNLYYTGTPGATYNPAVGLGVPDLTEVSAALGQTARS